MRPQIMNILPCCGLGTQETCVVSAPLSHIVHSMGKTLLQHLNDKKNLTVLSWKCFYRKQHISNTTEANLLVYTIALMKG